MFNFIIRVVRTIRRVSRQRALLWIKIESQEESSEHNTQCLFCFMYLNDLKVVMVNALAFGILQLLLIK